MNFSPGKMMPRSGFVTVLAWIFVVLAGFATVISLLQNIIVVAIVFAALFGWIAKRLMSDDIKQELLAP